MVKLVLGTKGKGKTKYMLENANKEAEQSDGLVIYLDKNSEHMFQLTRPIRLINVKEYPVNSLDTLLGFVCGLIAGNSDIVSIYFDSFLILSELKPADAGDAIDRLVALSKKLGVEFVVSMSIDSSDVPEDYKQFIALAL
ncbi:MAG: twitching motility protein PilT [Lachnospiraceae bacterium]|jgi:hypothetical protein